MATQAARENEKAQRYIAQLETARSTAQWEQIPELTRKVLKHAPSRRCLVLTAQTESQVANYQPPLDTLERPPTSGTNSSVASSSLAKLIAPLLRAIDEETIHTEDAFQATCCVGWIHWVLHEPQLAIARLPRDIMGHLTQILASPQTTSEAWITVCALKAVYIKGFSLEKTVGSQQGLDVYVSALSFLSSQQSSLGSFSLDFRLWTERLLSRMVACSMKSKPLGAALELDAMLKMFHTWISLFRTTPTKTSDGPRSAPSTIELGAEVDYSRWDVWMSYYSTLSEILARGYIYAPSYTDKKPTLLYTADGVSEQDYLACRLRQRAELKEVEAQIEAKLLAETRFPKATERNSRVERWVDAIMANWRILCGPAWQDQELGEGGKNAIARGVLDILYRAATKSFHSTQILRYLFNVHAYVAEFDLAFRAFYTYVELVQKGKDREDKTGQPDYSLDDDNTTLHTVSEAICLLCRFGDRKQVEKARDVAMKLLHWLQRATQEAEAQESADPTTTVPLHIPISPASVAEAYTALGMAEATWARLTYDAPARNGHQQKAVDLFKTSLKVSFGEELNLNTSYQLALVLAEMRELNAAIKVIKTAMSRPSRGDFLSLSKSSGNGDDHTPSNVLARGSSETTDYEKERRFIPFWHLLTLLLTAKADLATAARTSNAAFEQFDDYSILFGVESQFKSEHLQETEATEKMTHSTGLVDRMDRHEKEGIIQVKLTQIAIKEELQGPAEAVQSSAELLALYARLFGDPRTELRGEATRLGTSKTGKSEVGSFRQSVFSRIGRSRSRAARPESVPSVPSLPSTRQPSIATTNNAPTINVTNEDGAVTEHKRHHLPHPHLGRSKSQHSVPRTGGSVRSRKERDEPRSTSQGRFQKRSTSQPRKSIENGRSRPGSLHTTDTVPVVDPYMDPVPTTQLQRSESKVSNFSLPRSSTALSEQRNRTQDLREIPHNLDRIEEPAPTGHKDQPPRQDVRLPAPHPLSGDVSPEPLFPVLQERRHKISLLIELWLLIAGLYTRAKLFEDGKAAVDEAEELVGMLELQMSNETSSAKAFAAKGWGGGKSVEELWGDVCASRGDLLAAQAEPYEAMISYEKALSHFPDHPCATVNLCALLLDIASGTLLPEAPEPPLFPSQTQPPNLPPRSHSSPATNTPETSPEELNRLAARDRAYGLLNGLTKLGSGWDYSEAWFALSRCYELGNQVDKAKEVLWWCVELEDTRPARRWSCVRGL